MVLIYINQWIWRVTVGIQMAWTEKGSDLTMLRRNSTEAISILKMETLKLMLTIEASNGREKIHHRNLKESNQNPSNQNPSNRNSSNQNLSNQNPSNQNPSNQNPSNQNPKTMNQSSNWGVWIQKVLIL